MTTQGGRRPPTKPSPRHAPTRRAGQVPAAIAGNDLDGVLAALRVCRVCAAELPLGARPLVQAGATARLLIVGQAPGAKAHASGVPWNDASGERLRDWLGIDRALFYDASRVAIVPMGYCYPGRGRGGDLPPRRECAALWLDALLARLPRIALTLLVGRHAQRHFLGPACEASLTATVAGFERHLPRYLPLPHPSPRNTGWFKRHAWFERDLLPVLRERVHALVPPAAAPALP
jgi:uracil-DNA glycosylase